MGFSNIVVNLPLRREDLHTCQDVQLTQALGAYWMWSGALSSILPPSSVPGARSKKGMVAATHHHRGLWLSMGMVGLHLMKLKTEVAERSLFPGLALFLLRYVREWNGAIS
jgi:hypothetical protein